MHRRVANCPLRRFNYHRITGKNRAAAVNDKKFGSERHGSSAHG